jgi:nitrogen-specific signal transduction histidine kinase/CheY-like chemotaxis protein
MWIHTSKASKSRRSSRAPGDSGSGQFENIGVIERLAESVAHEMNNVLSAIMGLASVVQSEHEPEDESYLDLQGILDASKKGLTLTRNLLGFAQREPQRKERIDLNRLIGVTCGLLQRTVSPKVSIQTRLAEDLVEIDGDPSQLKHVLVNLATNAIEALGSARGKRILTMATSNVMLSAEDLSAFEELVPGEYVRLQVSDTGPGMSDETIERAFQPFFSTKGKGTGLGLAVVLDSVVGHRGRIGVVSRSGIGTTVTVDLPSAALSSTLPESPTSVRRTIIPHAGAALIVDDEPLILHTGERVLGRLGYRVHLASSGKQALETYAKHGRDITFVLLDLIMPEMDGAEVLETLLELDPAAKVIVSSGFGSDASREEMTARGAAGYLDKPYTVQQLQHVLREVLENDD